MVIGRNFLFLLLSVLMSVPERGCAWIRNWREVDDLIERWSPLVWLAPDEKYLPSNVEDLLSNVYVADENGKKVAPYNNRRVDRFNTKGLNLMTYRSIETLQNDTNSFIFGKNPTKNSVSIYALVTKCGPPSKKTENEVLENTENLYFHVSYWIFYPYNEGKEVCVIGNVPTPRLFNTCLGQLKTLGNHVGDWEHITLSFNGKNTPDTLYLAVHDTGSYYKYSEKNRHFKFQFQEKSKGVPQVVKFPEILHTQGDHPVVFSAYGSHGMWASPGELEYARVPKLTDKTGFGIPWKTWSDIKIHHLGYDPLPHWMSFRGRWGNPKKNCLLIKKLGICEYSDGPLGILREKKDFHCSYNG